jgi:hypothetical protein
MECTLELDLSDFTEPPNLDLTASTWDEKKLNSLPPLPPLETQNMCNPSNLGETNLGSPKKRKKGVTPVQKLTKEFRRALVGIPEPVFPNDFMLTKKVTVYIRECFQIFARDLCENSSNQHALLHYYFQAAGPVRQQKEEAYKFLLSFFSNNRQICVALKDVNFYTAGYEISQSGVLLLKRILWYYSNQI